MKKLITEFIGTFFLILTIGLAVLGGAGAMAPVAIGLALMVMVYAGGHISGAHFNPAVTLGILIRGKITVADAVPYMIVQVVAGAIAAFVVQYLLGSDKVTALAAAANPNAVKALVAEILGTFALVFVVLNVATSKATAGNSYFGLAIGLTVTAMAYALGGISGGAFNPAVAVGISVMKMAQWADIWFYLVGGFGGAVLAALLFKHCNPDDL
ncbi:MAG TPA: aquaporin [Ferruginibacter sp.]|jgi:aquaporin Z|nr:aquaporin [Bacteroidota bacterium]MCC6691876.1 aquaporin [Chitinophagaceae bacterium]HMT95655.1 aquaporin [Ferruginibacter sp.]HMU23956.1 aquaporin [Ferruginibacter sp.]